MNAHASSTQTTGLTQADVAEIRAQYSVVNECIYWNNAAVSPI